MGDYNVNLEIMFGFFRRQPRYLLSA